MKPGAVVTTAAETGGNTELTRAGETVDASGVAIIGPVNLPARTATHASEMLARNLFNLPSCWSAMANWPLTLKTTWWPAAA